MRQGKDPVTPKAGHNTAQSYLYQLFGEEPDEKHWRPLEIYLTLLADHGMNASTFTARVIASTGSDLCSAITGAVGALKGPLHGGAPSKVLDMLEAIGSAENVDAWLTARARSRRPADGVWASGLQGRGSARRNPARYGARGQHPRVLRAFAAHRRARARHAGRAQARAGDCTPTSSSIPPRSSRRSGSRATCSLPPLPSRAL